MNKLEKFKEKYDHSLGHSDPFTVGWWFEKMEHAYELAMKAHREYFEGDDRFYYELFQEYYSLHLRIKDRIIDQLGSKYEYLTKKQ